MSTVWKNQYGRVDSCQAMLMLNKWRKIDGDEPALYRTLSEVYPLFFESGESVTAGMRIEMASWIVEASMKLNYSSVTTSLAVVILDSFLLTVKAHQKYKEIIGASCLFIAGKIEEDEHVHSAEKFLSIVRCTRTGAELKRMELCVLDKLGWQIFLPNPISYLHIFHQLLLFASPINSLSPPTLGIPTAENESLQRSLLTRRALRVQTGVCGLYYSSRIIGCTVVAMMAETYGLDGWIPSVLRLGQYAEVGQSDMISCRQMILYYHGPMTAPSSVVTVGTSEPYSLKGVVSRKRDIATTKVNADKRKKKPALDGNRVFVNNSVVTSNRKWDFDDDVYEFMHTLLTHDEENFVDKSVNSSASEEKKSGRLITKNCRVVCGRSFSDVVRFGAITSC